MAENKSSVLTISILCLGCLIIGWVLGRNSPKRETEISSPTVSEEIRSTNSRTIPIGVEASAQAEFDTPEYLNIDYTLSAGVLLQQANEINDTAQRQLYLRTLLSHWIEYDPLITSEIKDQFLAGMLPGSRFQTLGYEVLFSHYASLLSDGSKRRAWKLNFANHPARSEIYTMFLSRDMANTNPDKLFETSKQWNLWERNHYNDQLIAKWTQQEPNRAFAWYEANPSQFGGNIQQTVFDIWAKQDFDGLSAHLVAIGNTETRNRAIESLARHMAYTGTDAALDWANSFLSIVDQDLAHDTIYQETPRGIGAILAHENGFPKVVQPLVENGLQAGDLIISALNDGSELTDFYGKDLMTSVEALRGSPGTNVTLQIMRKDPETGEYRQAEVTITRQQLWMEKEDQP